MNNKKTQKLIDEGKLIPFEQTLKEAYPTKEAWDEFLKEVEKERKENERLIRERVARNIKSARESVGITQEELSKRMKTPKTYISKVENGKQNVSVDFIAKVAKALGKKVKLTIE